MKICYVNPFFYPFRGGIEHRIYNIGKRLAKGNEVYVVTTKLNGTVDEEKIDGLKVIRLDGKFLNIYNPPFVWCKGVSNKIKEIEPDIVDFHYRWAPSYTREIIKLRCPLVFTFHNDFGEGVGIEKVGSYINDLIFKIYLKRFDKIICISNYIKNRLIEKGIEKNKLVTIHNGIDCEDAKFYGNRNDYLFFVGRLVRTKGIDILLKAIKNMDIEIKIAGKGPMKRKWEDMAKKYKINAEFLGWISEEEKIEHMKKCRAFILPSRFESFGLVLLEAMKYGAPIIATNVGGIPEVVGNAGLLTEPNPKEMRMAIKKIFDDELAEKLGKEGVKRVKLFSWEESAKKTIKLYEEILKGDKWRRRK